MLAFQVKIQLDQAFDCDYTKLHDLMFRHGFFRSVRTADGSWFQLPPMEYSHYSAFDLSPTVVHEKVVTIAAKTGRRSWVTVFKHNAVTRSTLSAPPERLIGTL